jgi:hypothetical protein
MRGSQLGRRALKQERVQIIRCDQCMQATVDGAVNVAKEGLNLAKQAGMELLSKAQNLIGGGQKAEKILEPEL